MHAELQVPAASLIAFLLVLARMTGVFVFVPLPWKDSGPSMARIVFAVGATIALYSRWPTLNVTEINLPTIAVFIVSDAALGAAIGLMVSFLSEAFTVGAQSLALQAGYGYASVVDPTTQADSDVLAVLAQLMAGLFFFTTGLHRYLIKAFADSLESYPPGTFALTQGLMQEVLRLSSGIFLFGLRLALPIVGLLLMTEISLGLVGRITPQLHLGSHAFPLKMMLTLLMLAAIVVVTPQLYRAYAEQVFRSIQHSFLH